MNNQDIIPNGDFVQNAILFSSPSEFYGPFSNFSKHAITVNGKLYGTTEHYYQSMKFLDSAIQEQIRMALTPKEAKQIAYNNSSLIRKDWENIKYSVMKGALQIKLQQHEKVFDLLMSTGNKEIIENRKTDQVWGIGDGTGENLLGKCWMELREQFSKMPWRLVVTQTVGLGIEG